MKTDQPIPTKGLTITFTIVLLYGLVFALYYPLSTYNSRPLIGIFLTSPTTLFYLVFSLAGLTLAIKNREKITRQAIIISLIIASLVWVSVQSLYIYNHWTPIIPYYAPTVTAAQTLIMTLGYIALDTKKPRLSLLDDNLSQVAKSVGTGLLLGIILGLINIGLFVFLNGQAISRGSILYGSLKALQPGILEEVSYRLFFMGATIMLLEKHLPNKTADTLALAMAILFHALPHVPELILTNPVAALMTVTFLSLIFGLPMALLAYRRDIETAISLHWTIDVIRFILLS